MLRNEARRNLTQGNLNKAIFYHSVFYHNVDLLYRMVPRHHVNGKPIRSYKERFQIEPFQSPRVNAALGMSGSCEYISRIERRYTISELENRAPLLDDKLSLLLYGSRLFFTEFYKLMKQRGGLTESWAPGHLLDGPLSLCQRE